MKMYTHAWLAFMAMKRLQYADLDTMSDKKVVADAKALVKWFKNYRDFVIEGAWYPDHVFKDMKESHVIKYKPVPVEKVEKMTPEELAAYPKFHKLPASISMYNQGKKSSLYNKPFVITGGNCADRCEAICHDLVDNLKMLRTEDKGSPIAPSNNHIAMRFFILSHYIADCHMPLHCDNRSFSEGADIHGWIEGQWEDNIKKSYSIDKDNDRFFYDPQGYPLATDKQSQLMKDIEAEIIGRHYVHSWGTDNGNTWDYMSAVSEFSYLKAYRMIPKEYDHTNINADVFKTLEGGINFDQYTKEILCDAVDSISRAWLHAWSRYRRWAKL